MSTVDLLFLLLLLTILLLANYSGAFKPAFTIEDLRLIFEGRF